VVNNGGYIKDNTNTLNGFLKFNYEPAYLKGFGAYISYDYNKFFDLTKTRYTPYPLYHFNLFGQHNHLVGDSVVQIVSAQQQPYDFFQEGYSQTTEYTLDAEMHYNHVFGQHNIGLQFLYEQYENAADNFSAQGQQLLSSTIDELFFASSDPNRRSISGSGSELGRESYFGRLNYRFKDRYLLQAMARFDGSSAFAPKNRWGFFPALSAGWIMSEEPFIKKILPSADNLKLRASYGLMGYDDPNYVALSQWYSYYSIVGSAVFNNVANTIAPRLYPNPDITWQKIANTDIGLDASFLNGLISGSFDWYFKKTTDLLVTNTAIVPSTFGLPLAQKNYGQVNAQGIDISLRHDNRIGKLKYYVGVNFNYNTNKVIKYPQAANVLDYQKRVGRPVNFITGYEAIGIARTDKDLQNLPKYGTRPFELGDIIFKDIAGPNGSGPDGVVNSNDNTVLSLTSYDPLIVYGISIGASFEGFDLNILIQGVGKRTIIFPDRSQWQEQNVESFWADAWTPSNVNGLILKSAVSMVRKGPVHHSG
jgi:TonB-linked SusC/RagA family outer membrane protein